MTPLAYRIVKDMTLPMKQRTFDDIHRNLLPHFRQEFHCFEVSQIHQHALDVKSEMVGASFPSLAWSFLPAERTWIEWKNEGRRGAMLVRDGEYGRVWQAWSATGEHGRQIFGGMYLGRMALSDALAKIGPGFEAIEESIFDGLIHHSDTALHHRRRGAAVSTLWLLYAYLLLINTPRVVGRSKHDPHRGLAREILTKRKMLGIFPLQAWTEIVLTTEAIDASDDRPESSRLSGTMPLHWTRAHKKRVHGLWTLISDYWSGDGSLGIRQSRYKLVPADGVQQ